MWVYKKQTWNLKKLYAVYKFKYLEHKMVHSYRSKRNTFCLFLHNSSECEVDGKCYWPTEVYHTPYQNDGVQGIIQKKSASDIQMLPLVIFEKKYPFCQKYCYFKIFLGKTSPKVPFFKDSRCCPKILDYTLVCPDNLKSVWYINVKIVQQLNW